MTVSSIRPVEEKKKSVKEQKNLQQKEVAMVFFCALELGVGRVSTSLLCWAGSCKSESLKAWLLGAVRKIHCHARVRELVFYSTGNC